MGLLNFKALKTFLSFRRPGYEGLGLNQGSLVVGSGSGPLHLYFPGGPQLSFGFKATTQKVFNLDSFKVAPRKNIEQKGPNDQTQKTNGLQLISSELPFNP